MAVLLFLGLAALEPLSSETIEKVRDVSSLLAPIVERHQMPGMAGAIVTGKGTLALGVTGVRRRGSDEKMTINDLYHLGSCTKAMTATLCAILVEKKKLSWNTTIARAFPKLKEIHPDYRNVTLEQLLTNRGGVPTSLDAGGLWGRLWRHKGSPASARRLLLEGVIARAPVSPPGTKFIYSNGGFSIAGHMAETVMKTSYEELLVKEVFKPIGITTAGFGAPGNRDALGQPRGHTTAGKPVEPGPGADNPVAVSPAGRVHCTIEDWGKFVSLHLRGAKGDTKLLKRSSFRKLHQSPKGPGSSYAMGWGIHRRNWGGKVMNHSGSNTMWYVTTWVAPEKNFAVLSACNQGGKRATKACDEASGALIQYYLKRK